MTERLKSSALWCFYLLAVIPTLTELLESGRLPASPREVITEVALTSILLLVAWKLRRVYRGLAYASARDSLTGLYNRREFQLDLRREVYRAQRLGTSLTVAYIDADRFKAINDTFGHEVGDRVLEAIAAVLEGATRRQVDRCYRIGGDEFAVVMPGGNPDAARATARRVTDLGSHDFLVLGTYQVGLSIGTAILTPDDAPEQLARRADCLMYEQKSSKGRVSAELAVG